MTAWEDLTEKEQLLTYISDAYKDAYGFRPRGLFNDYSVEELKVRLDELVDQANAQYEEELKMKTNNWNDFHKELADLDNIGAKDYRQALAWDMDAEDVHGDFEYYCYRKGFEYNKKNAIQRLAR